MKSAVVLLAFFACCYGMALERTQMLARQFEETQKRYQGIDDPHLSSFLYFPAEGQCEYDKYEGKRSPGSENTDVKTYAECEALCSGNHRCRAFEFFEAGTWQGIHCRLHVTHPLFIEAQPTVDTYIRQPCHNDDDVCYLTGQDHYLIGYNSHIEGGTPYYQIPINSSYECMQLCTANPFCWAVDYSRKEHPWMGSWCWLHEDRAMYINLKTNAKWDFYWKVACNGDYSFAVTGGSLDFLKATQDETVQPGMETKPGTCPGSDLPGWELYSCSEDCTHDAVCPDAQKCCNTGCGHTCMQPTEYALLAGKRSYK